ALRGLDAAKLHAAFADARDASAAAEAEVLRRAEAAPAFTAATTLAAARSAVSEEEQSLRGAETEEEQEKKIRERAAAALQTADDILTTHLQTIAEHTQKMANSRAQLRLLVEAHGEDLARLQALVGALESLTKANDLLEAT